MQFWPGALPLHRPWFFMVKINGQTISKLFTRGISLDRLKRAGRDLFARANPPTIDSFASNVQQIDLDSRATGRIILTWATTGAGACKVLEQGGSVLLSSSLSGSVQIPQPRETTSYLLTASNRQGSVTRVVTVRVVQAPVITNLRRTRALQGLYGIVSYEFRAFVTGSPKPTATYRINQGQETAVRSLRRSDDTPGGYELVLMKSLNSELNHSLTVTVTNSSGSDSATIDNINA